MKVEECFRIGTITKTRGLKGEFQVFIDFDEPQALKFNTVFLEISGKLTPYFVSSFKIPMANSAYLKLEDIDSIEAASKLIKKDIYLANTQKPKRKKEAFGLKDLKGFFVEDENHGELGEIFSIDEFPQQLIATLSYKEKEIMFPLNETIIKGIDVVSKTLMVDLPEGLLNVYLD
jgi:16S rRNA processing protein RimM